MDREERPDVDQVYMNAVQLMTGRGGWPLNVVALPDGRPIWGGTYFPKAQWMDALVKIAELYKKDPEKFKEYANQLEQGVKSLDVVQLNAEAPEFNEAFINTAVNQWSERFDHEYGGIKRAPKFMMPNNYHFLWRYAFQTNNKELKDYLNLTLTKMAYGGIFDQIGGGFSRYSVDEKWHVPHFEKMLYDNGQLVSLYADAYASTKDPLYKSVVFETLDFIQKELTAENGAFYSSLDADSKTPEGELEEGAYYIWTKPELQTLINEDFELFSNYYNINDYGFWEHDQYVLIRNTSDENFRKKHQITAELLQQKIQDWQTTLLQAREKRSKPRLDDKTLTSWNALMLKGYLDAYRVFGNGDYLASAEKNANFILNTQLKPDGGLYHNYKNGTSSINGYLEDYAASIDAFIALYENTFDDKWLTASRDLANYALDHFYNEANSMFYFTSNKDTALLSRTIEYQDNVIPASNSMMAKNLFKLANYFDNNHFETIATKMLNNIKPEMEEHPTGYSNWFDLMLNYTNPYYEVVIVGNEAKQKLNTLNQHYIPNTLKAGSLNENNMPLLKNRFNPDKTLIYVCVDKTCKLPVETIEKAMKFIVQ